MVIRLAFPGHVRQLIVDTAHFKYNASAEIAVQASGREPAPAAASPDWTPLPGQWLDQLRAGRAGLSSGRPRAADLEALAAMLEGPAAERA